MRRARLYVAKSLNEKKDKNSTPPVLSPLVIAAHKSWGISA